MENKETEIPWTVPCRESQTDRKIGVFDVRIWRNVPLDWSAPFDSVVDEWLHKASNLDFVSMGALEDYLAQIPDVTAIQIGRSGNNTVLYLG